MKKWQIWYVCLGALFLLSGVVGCLLLHFAPDAGLAGVKSVANLARLPVRLVWAQGDVVEGNETAALALEDLTGNQQQYVQEMLAADLAVLATATGELDITSSTLGQEIVVERVLQGNGLDAGSTCTVWQEYGLQVIDGEIAYNNVLNLMQPGKQYLIFLTDQSLNRVSDDRNYLVASTWFGYLPVPFSPTMAIFSPGRTISRRRGAPMGCSSAVRTRVSSSASGRGTSLGVSTSSRFSSGTSTFCTPLSYPNSSVIAFLPQAAGPFSSMIQFSIAQRKFPCP